MSVPSAHGWPAALLVGTLLFALALLAACSAPSAAASAPSAAVHPPASYPPVTGSITGPAIAAQGTTFISYINGTGGPAYAPNGTVIGNITFYASIAAGNATGVSISPTSESLTVGIALPVTVSVGATVQTIVIQVMISSTYLGENVSTNLTHPIEVVAPYTLTGTVEAASETVGTFSLQVYLDGALVGTISIPTLIPHQSYNFTYKYVSQPLPSGSHTFTITMPSQHGLVSFAGGATQYSTTFYVAGPPADYTVYYVLGVVAFVGVIIISLMFVGARRRGGSRT